MSENQTSPRCYHGGAFFREIGEHFDHLERHADVINADVLDAWFPPAPGVLSILQQYLPWLLRTSPPTECQGLTEEIAAARGVPPDCILPGAGSSDLIFRVFPRWLQPQSRALILDPMYGEYAHVLEHIIGCHVQRLPLAAEQNFRLQPDEFLAAVGQDFDLIVLVNPNSPTGQHVPRGQLQELLQHVPRRTRVWIDETYVDYVGTQESLEQYAADSQNVVVCKSMSKGYALSGARVAYLCGGPRQLEELRRFTPPWAVSLPAQVAAVYALHDPAYYAQRMSETAVLRQQLTSGLTALGWQVLPSVTNFLLCRLPPSGPDADTVAEQCRQRELFLRNPASQGSRLGTHLIRIAVKDAPTNQKMLAILREVVHSAAPQRTA